MTRTVTVTLLIITSPHAHFPHVLEGTKVHVEFNSHRTHNRCLVLPRSLRSFCAVFKWHLIHGPAISSARCRSVWPALPSGMHSQCCVLEQHIRLVTLTRHTLGSNLVTYAARVRRILTSLLPECRQDYQQYLVVSRIPPLSQVASPTSSQKFGTLSNRSSALFTEKDFEQYIIIFPLLHVTAALSMTTTHDHPAHD